MSKILLALLLGMPSWGQAPTAYADAIIPHLPVGCGFAPSLIMVNPTNRKVNYKVKFFHTDGTLKNVSIGGKSDSERSGMIGENGTVELVMDKSEAGAPACGGWAEVSADEVVAGYVTLAQDTKLLLNTDIQGVKQQILVPVITQSAVPFASRFANRFLVPFRMKSIDPPKFPYGVVTGIALVNPSPDQPAVVTISYRQSSGCVITKETISLGPLNQTSFTLGERTGFVSEDGKVVSLANLDGVAEISSTNIELAGFAIQFEGPNFVSFPGQAPITRPGGETEKKCISQ